jgi:hypothetical protein
MVAIEELQQKLESLLASVPPVDKELTEAEEMAEVDRRERQIETGQVRALTDAEFWREVEAGHK